MCGGFNEVDRLQFVSTLFILKVQYSFAKATSYIQHLTCLILICISNAFSSLLQSKKFNLQHYFSHTPGLYYG